MLWRKIDMHTGRTPSENWSYATSSQETTSQETRRKSWKRSFSNIIKGRMALHTHWSWTSSFQNYETMHFCCFKPLSLCFFVIAALRNWYTIRIFNAKSPLDYLSRNCTDQSNQNPRTLFWRPHFRTHIIEKKVKVQGFQIKY